MQQKQIYTTNSYKETQKIAEAFAKSLKGGEVICLYGDLGYGKTTFIQGLAKGLGITGRVISPTFIIMRTYKTKKNTYSSSDTEPVEGESRSNSSRQARTITFYHIDLYRINREQEIVDLGLSDIMNDPENIAAIEWPEKMGKLLPAKRIDVIFKYIDESVRKITIRKV